MKKGISLIVLVITIIVMIIIAGAIILSLNSSDVTGKATYAKIASDRANYQSELATEYAEYMAENYVEDPDGSEFTYSKASSLPAGFAMSGNLKVVYNAQLSGVPAETPDWYTYAG